MSRRWLHREKVYELPTLPHTYNLVFSERLSVVNSVVPQLTFCWYIRQQDWVLSSRTPAVSEPDLSVWVARGRKTFWLCGVALSWAHRPHAEEEWWTLALSSSAKCTLGLLCLHSGNSKTFRRPWQRGRDAGIQTSAFFRLPGWGHSWWAPPHCEDCTVIQDFKEEENTLWRDQVYALMCVTFLVTFFFFNREKGILLFLLSQQVQWIYHV